MWKISKVCGCKIYFPPIVCNCCGHKIITPFQIVGINYAFLLGNRVLGLRVLFVNHSLLCLIVSTG